MSEAAALESTTPEISEQITKQSDLAITESNGDYAAATPDNTQATQALVDSGALPELELTGLDTSAMDGLEGLSWPDFPDLPDLPDFPELPPIRNPFEDPPQTVSGTITELTPEQMQQEIKDMGLPSDQVPGSNPPTTIYYVIGDGGKRTEVLRTDETTIEGKYAALTAERDRLIADTEQKYGVDILTSGTRNQFEKTFTVRPPTISELHVLRDGLHNSQPSNLQSGEQLKIGYIKGDFPDGVLAVYNQENPPSIFMGSNRHKNYGEQLLTLNHELAHSGQYNMMEHNRNYEAELAAATGYRNVNGMWLIEGENPGEFYRTAEGKLFEYVRVNERGEMLRADGTVTKNLEEVDLLTAENVRNRARVRPVTEYFPTPVEANAEALAYYRSNEDRRWAVIMNDPELYDATKRFDQAEIDRAYGRNQDGSSKYIRGLNGSVVENNAQNREEIRIWEEANRREAEAVRQQPNEAMPTAVGHGHGGGCSCSL